MIHTKVEQTVTTTEFRERLDHYFAATKTGGGPVVVTEGNQVIGVFIAGEDYESMSGTVIRELLRERLRERGPTLSHEEVMARCRAAIRRSRHESRGD